MGFRHPPNLARVDVLVRAPWKKYFFGAVLAAFYGISIQRGVQTAGEPYAWALQEQKEAIKEKAKLAQEAVVSHQSGDKQKDDLKIDEEALPSQYLPNVWACALIFTTVTLQILFHLMCHWSIRFKAAVLFEPSRRIKCGSFLLIFPHSNKGKAAICRIEESEVTLKFRTCFQYQTYEIVEADEPEPDLVGDVRDPGMKTVRSPTNLVLREYRSSKGLQTQSEVEKAHDRFGANIFELPRPTFMTLFKKQLMAPLAIFQFFCTALWTLDTYWKYTCFTLLSVLGFEASTAFQRLKSLATLRGMGTKTYDVGVFRLGEWTAKPIEELLPGDIISLSTGSHVALEQKKKNEQQPADSNKKEEKQHLVVPCDCLLLSGGAIVNEATLTGESVPQMKDEIAPSNPEDTVVEPFGKHRVHALFSGTSLIKAASKADQADSQGCGTAVALAVPPTPDGGIVCYVLRTGFNSSQGELMRMIEFSTQEVSADKLETAGQLLFLLFFALLAAGFVLKKGLQEPTGLTYKTLLRCILIVTSVVPPSLPMQMAFAVHTAIMSLLKGGIFCTEPFRVPYAGRVAHCFFDKTGTITSDQMVTAGVVNAEGQDDGKKQNDDGIKDCVPCKEASNMVAMVVAGCHSIVEVDGKAVGDPIEVAALTGIAWSYVSETNTASPGAWKSKDRFAETQREIIASLKDTVEAEKQEKNELQAKLDEFEKQLKVDKSVAKKLQVVIAHRFHFSSELQRMSTICKVTSSLPSRGATGVYCLTKGSPEAIFKLLAPTSKPVWYESTYRALAEKGQRVLALAYKILDGDCKSARSWSQKPREEVEQEMIFAGFISFKCETRKDSMLVIKALQDSHHDCTMLTGDAPLTALSVAHEVGMSGCVSGEALMLQETPEDSGSLEWVPAITAGSTQIREGHREAFDPAGVSALRKSHDLVVTGPTLDLVLASDHSDEFRNNMHLIHIYARLSPFQKEQIIQAVRKKQNQYTLMCGDGGNDVGALREADVGLALLSGFGKANASKPTGYELPQKDQIQDAEEALALQRQEGAEQAKVVAIKTKEELARKKKDLVAKQQQWVEEELEARRRRGESVGVMAHMAAVKSVMSRMHAEAKKDMELSQKKHGGDLASIAAKWAGEMDDADETPTVQLGDASIAAPFTSRTPSISACVDIVRQGRCTLLSAVQQMQIMMMESIISAYTMSAMSIDGTRPSEAQMMASGVLISVASLAFSFARPVDRMHPVRPLSSVFHPAILFSMLGQLAIHLACMVYIAQAAKDAMGPEKLQEVMDFEKKRNAQIDGMDEKAFDDWNWFLSVPFKNNMLNTCCWLVETSQQIAVIFVNYKGRPWMKGMLENQPLLLSLLMCTVLVAICACGAIPYLNETLNLEPLPESIQPKLMCTLFVSLIGSFLWDRFMVSVFAPKIMAAMVSEALATTWQDIVPVFKTVGCVVGGSLLLLSGNPILWGLTWMVYRHYKGKVAASSAAGTQGQKRGS